MDSAFVVDIIDELDWIEPTADCVSGAVRKTVENAGPVAQPVLNFLNGTWLGHPLHPALTDIPIGAWTVATALDTAEMFGCETAGAAADAAIAIGLAGAAASAVTGLADWQALDEGSKSRKVGVAHALLNIAATLLYGGSLALRKGKRRGLARLLSAAGYCLVGTSAFLGGILVYSQKVGVDHADRDGYPEGWVDVLAESDITDGKPACAKAADIEIVVVKKDDKIYALANRCSHLGGPLCDGEVNEDGVICPWHRSEFDLKTGLVKNGPATHRQPVFDTRVVDGRVQVKNSTNQPIAAYSVG